MFGNLTPPNLKPAFGAVMNPDDPMAPHIAGCWWLNEGAGITAMDSSFYKNHGMLIGG